MIEDLAIIGASNHYHFSYFHSN